MPPLMPAAPEIFLAIASMVLLMLGVFRGDKAARTVSWFAVLILLVCGVILTSVQDGRMVTFGGQFVVDDFAHFMKWLVLIGSALAIVMAMGFNEQAGIDRFEYPVLILFATIGMLMMVSANDLISLYIGLELQSLSLYVVAAFRRDSLRSSEAGLKYFVLGHAALRHVADLRLCRDDIVRRTGDPVQEPWRRRTKRRSGGRSCVPYFRTGV